MLILLLVTLFDHRASERLLNQGVQKDKISTTGTLIMLLREETLTGPDTMMAMTNMKGSHGITMMLQIIDQLEV